MGFKYTDRVYRDVHDTSPTEQMVLLALAHCADDKTGQCFPSVDTLVKRTHLGRSTVNRCLDSLRGKKLLEWIPGGRKKSGRVLSNLYRLRLPKRTPKAEEEVVFESWDDVDNSADCVPERDTYPSRSGTPHSLGAGHLPVSERDTNINITSIDHPEDHNPPPEAAGDKPGRFELGVARQNGMLEGVLKKVGDANEMTKSVETPGLVIDANEWAKSVETKGPVQLAMEAACTTSKEDCKMLGRTMMMKKIDALLEEIYRFDCERRAGAFQNIKSLPAHLNARLASLPDRDDL